MEYKSPYVRINNVKDIDYISKEICRNYNLGTFKKSELIEIGYEDFNYYLFTENDRYVVKIFNVERDNSSCERLIDILLKSFASIYSFRIIFAIETLFFAFLFFFSFFS